MDTIFTNSVLYPEKNGPPALEQDRKSKLEEVTLGIWFLKCPDLLVAAFEQVGGTAVSTAAGMSSSSAAQVNGNWNRFASAQDDAV